MGWGLLGIKFVTGIGDGRNNENDDYCSKHCIAFPFPYPGQIFANIKLIQAYINYFTLQTNGFPPNITQYYLFILFSSMLPICN